LDTDLHIVTTPIFRDETLQLVLHLIDIIGTLLTAACVHAKLSTSGSYNLVVAGWRGSPTAAFKVSSALH
jgi:hypothetical protein